MGSSPLENTMVLFNRNENTCLFLKDAGIKILELEGDFSNVYSSQILQKSLLVGSKSKIVNFAVGGDMRYLKDSSPSSISECLFTKGYRWICLNQSQKEVFLFDIIRERTFMTFSPNQSHILKKISSPKCALVSNSRSLLCVGIEQTSDYLKHEIVQRLSLFDPAGLFQADGFVNDPHKNITYLDSFNDMVSMVETTKKLKVTIFNYTSSSIVNSYE